MDIDIRAARVLDQLARSGYEAYVVGGCVRDRIRGVEPKDWDIATSALPEQVKDCFADKSVIETGLKYGTVTVAFDGLPLEVTTFRVDGPYSDDRHPDTVTFVGNLRDDLARRDFTINALAYAPHTGLVDYFGGVGDLERGVVRCVGDPGERLREDALRIMRALRFGAVLGFAIDPGLAHSLHENRGLLGQVAVERVRVELMKMLVGEDILAVLLEFPDVLAQLIPEITPAVGFDQHNRHHRYDVWEHTARSVAYSCPSAIVRLTLLLHDLGKPGMFSRGDDGVGHFRGHARLSEELARARLGELRFDTATINTVARLVKYHDAIMPDGRLLRWLNRLGEDTLRLLIEVKRGDIKAAHEDFVPERLKVLGELEQELDAVIAAGTCFSLRDLAVSGRDLMALGIEEGPAVGEALQRLLEDVMDGAVPNEREALLRRVFTLPLSS